MRRRVVLMLLAGVLVLTACGTRGADTSGLEIQATGAAPPTSAAGSPAPPAQPKGPVDPQKVVDYLKSAGLPIGRADRYDAQSDPFKLAGRPSSYALMVIFFDEKAGSQGCKNIQTMLWPKCGGKVETFSSEQDLTKWVQVIELARKQAPNASPEYRYQNGLILLRLGNVITPDQAKAYEKAFNAFPG